jgi:hypothetical protein
MKIKITENFPGFGRVVLAIVTFGSDTPYDTAKTLILREWDNFKCGEPDSDSQFYEWLEKRGYDVSEMEEMAEIVVD